MNLNNHLLAVIGLLFFSVGILAQKLPVPSDDVPESGLNEVECYAVEDRWVCVPKGSEKPTAVSEQIKAEAESVTDEAPVNPLVPPKGVESITDTVPETNALLDPSADELTAESPEVISVPEAERQPTQPVEQTVETSQTADYAGDNWFQRYPNHWTIQIVGVANQQNLDAFIKQQQLNDQDYRIVETEISDAPWWVVIYGHYPNRDAADNARQNLPAHLVDDAWLRPLSSLAGED